MREQLVRGNFIMKPIKVSAVALLGIFVSSTAFAATVEPIGGSVSVNAGSGYKVISAPVQAKPGDVILTSSGASARVVYTDQCSIVVKSGRVVSIAPEPPCKKTASFDPYGTRMNAGVYDGGKGFEEPPRRHHWLPYAVVAGGVVAAGLCIGDVICDDDDKRASP